MILEPNEFYLVELMGIPKFRMSGYVICKATKKVKIDNDENGNIKSKNIIVLESEISGERIDFDEIVSATHINTINKLNHFVFDKYDGVEGNQDSVFVYTPDSKKIEIINENEILGAYKVTSRVGIPCGNDYNNWAYFLLRDKSLYEGLSTDDKMIISKCRYYKYDIFKEKDIKNKKQAVVCENQDKFICISTMLNYNFKDNRFDRYKENTVIGLDERSYGTLDVSFNGYEIINFDDFIKI